MAQPHSIISPREGAELERLHEEYAVATRRAADALQANDRQRFLEEEGSPTLSDASTLSDA